MANERLRTAMQAAHVGVDEIAQAAEVDPKTVQRWVSGRPPHARHRWAVARLLNEREEFLWPGRAQQVSSKAGGGAECTSEVVRAFARRSDVGSGDWWVLLSSAQAQIDLLGYAMHFLPE